MNTDLSRIIATLSLVTRLREEEEMLFGWKTRKFCKDHWVPYGGKKEPGETLVRCAKRELQAEAGLVARFMNKCAVLLFHNKDKDAPLTVEVHVYFAEDWHGEPHEKDPAIIRPTWFPIRKLPEKIPLADKLWLPKVLNGEFIEGEFWYVENSFDSFARQPIIRSVSAFHQ